MSKIAGVDLVPTLECDIGHINVSVGLDEKPKKGEDQDSAFGWHVDSVPFVTVTMLSDCTGMVGGETAIRTGSGEVIKVRGPTMVCLVVVILIDRVGADSFPGHCRTHARALS